MLGVSPRIIPALHEIVCRDTQTAAHLVIVAGDRTTGTLPGSRYHNKPSLAVVFLP